MLEELKETKTNKKIFQYSDFRLSSLQFGFSIPAHRNIIAESWSWFPLRSSSLKWDGSDRRAKATVLQSASESPQFLSLEDKEKTDLCNAHAVKMKQWDVNVCK